jgi:hypothetical protein
MRRRSSGRPTKYLRRNPRHAPVPVKNLAFALPRQAWKKLSCEKEPAVGSAPVSQPCAFGRCIAAYGFLVAERSRFFPSARAGRLDLSIPEMPSQFRPRGSPGSPTACIIPGRLPHSDKPSPGFFVDNPPVVLFVALHTYNTVVLASSDRAAPREQHSMECVERRRRACRWITVTGVACSSRSSVSTPRTRGFQ